MWPQQIKSNIGDTVNGIPITIKLTGVKKTERAIKRLRFFVRVMTWACKPINVKVHINDSLIEADNNKEVQE